MYLPPHRHFETLLIFVLFRVVKNRFLFFFILIGKNKSQLPLTKTWDDQILVVSIMRGSFRLRHPVPILDSYKNLFVTFTKTTFTIPGLKFIVISPTKLSKLVGHPFQGQNMSRSQFEPRKLGIYNKEVSHETRIETTFLTSYSVYFETDESISLSKKLWSIKRKEPCKRVTSRKGY